MSQGTQTWSAHSTDFGQTWQQEGALPGLFVAADDLTCVAGGTCLVAGYVPTGNGHGEGAIALSGDGGQTWALASVPAGIGLLQSTACASATECLAAGTTTTTVERRRPGQGRAPAQRRRRAHLDAVDRPRPVDDVYGVACPDARAVRHGRAPTGSASRPSAPGAVAQSVDGGPTFRASKAAYVPLSLTALACPTSAACVAVGGNTVARLALLAARAADTVSHPTGSVPSSAQGAGEQRTRNGA